MIDAGKFLRSGIGDDAAVFEKDDARGQEQRFAKIVCDKDDGLAETAREGTEFALKLGAGDGIKCAEGLIHEKDGRVGSQRTRYADTLTLTAGEFVRLAGSEFSGVEANESEKFVDTRLDAGGIPFFERRDERDVLGDSEMGEEPRFLNYIADAAAQTNRIPFGGGAATNDDLPGSGNE